ncbi:hypothetical protein N7535_003641 [Penicillium sp. DV-2018c]|nr:hypothetical protein N7461_000656 [Penicillium sp. DV-2018c]KAJ5576715.1 hypothetical protein N7535_003641 [Penicillium sp. DV-2018c]
MANPLAYVEEGNGEWQHRVLNAVGNETGGVGGCGELSEEVDRVLFIVVEKDGCAEGRSLTAVGQRCEEWVIV